MILKDELDENYRKAINEFVLTGQVVINSQGGTVAKFKAVLGSVERDKRKRFIKNVPRGTELYLMSNWRSFKSGQQLFKIGKRSGHVVCNLNGGITRIPYSVVGCKAFDVLRKLTT